MGFIIALHVLVCIFLIVMILIQQGKGGGLIDNLSSMESVLGTKTNAFLTKTTSVLAVLFFLTCLSLAFLSLKQSRSLMRQIKPTPMAAQSQPAKAAAAAPAAQTAKAAVQETAKAATQEAPKAPQAAAPAKTVAQEAAPQQK